MRKTTFVSIHLTHEARDALRLATLRLQAEVGRRLTQSDVVLAALTASEGRLIDALKPPGNG